MKKKCGKKILKKIKKFFKKNRKIITNLSGIFVVIIVIITAWLGANSIQEKSKPQNNINQYTAENEKEIPKTVDDILLKIKKHIKIDFDEEPLIVKIEDAELLKEQQDFFENSQDGDIVLVYYEKAIIYRPSLDILINVGPVQLPNLQENEISIEIRNGSKISGLAGSFGDILETKNYKIEKICDASRDDYSEDMLVNISGKDISRLEYEVGQQAVNLLPKGETESGADVLVILGNN